MATDRNERIRAEAITSINDAFSSAVHFKSSHNDLMTRVNAVYARYPKIPRWLYNYLRGYTDCKYKAIYPLLVFGRWHDGEFYSTHRDRADSVDQRGMTYEAFSKLPGESAHYWAADPTKPY